MNKFLAMMIEETNITAPTFFAKVVNSESGHRAFDVDSVNTDQIMKRPLIKAWFMECLLALDNENMIEGIGSCTAKVICPFLNEQWTIYYSDETTSKTH